MYIVKTEQRSYNSVDSIRAFRTIRENWDDNTPAIEIWSWVTFDGNPPYWYKHERIVNWFQPRDE
jgi:hypothetical protein